MATLKELYDFVGSADSSDLRNKINTAIAIKAMNIVSTASTTDAQNLFARQALGNPQVFEAIVLNTAVANAQINTPAITVQQIRDASDADIQAAVNLVVDNLLSVAITTPSA